VTENLVSGVVTVLLAIIGVAIIAVLVSQRAQTPQVLSAAGGAFSSTLGAALTPIVGSGFSGPAGSLY
jgi:PRD1 phage membrane DNA delivery